MAGFAGVESQTGGTYIGNLIVGAQPRQGKRRVLTCDQNQVHIARLAGDQPLDGIDDGAFADHVEVIQYENEPASNRKDVVDQRGCEGADGRRLTGLQSECRLAADAVIHPLQRGQQIGEESDGIVVGRLQ